MFDLLNHTLFIIALYGVFSITEHLVHRYVMHNNFGAFSKDHWTHHQHTLDDMTLKQSNNYNEDVNKYFGLFFVWPYTVGVFTVGFIEAYGLSIVFNAVNMNISLLAVLLYVLAFCFYQSSFWNTIHPDIHFITEKLSWSEGIPGSDIWKSIFESIPMDGNKNAYDWLKDNHIMHHIRKGPKKGNYNVTLPGADWLFGKLYAADEKNK